MARNASGPSTDPAPLKTPPAPIRRDGARAPDVGRSFDIDELAPADVVTLDGAPYELSRSGSLSLVEQARLARSWKRMSAVDKKIADGVEPASKELTLYRQDAETLAGLALRTLPAARIAELSDSQLSRIVLVFFTRAATVGGLSRTIRELLPATPPATTSPSSPMPTALIQ